MTMLPREELLEKFGDNVPILRKTVGIFLDIWEPEMEALRQALTDNDSVAASKKAHRLKGFVGYFVTEAAYDRVKALEDAAKRDDLPRAREMMATLEAEMTILAADLADLRLALPEDDPPPPSP